MAESACYCTDLTPGGCHKESTNLEEFHAFLMGEVAFDALEWLAAMCFYVPNKGQQMVRYVGFYRNVARGKRKKNDQDELIPSILEPEGSAKEYKRN